MIMVGIAIAVMTLAAIWLAWFGLAFLIGRGSVVQASSLATRAVAVTCYVGAVAGGLWWLIRWVLQANGE